MSKKLSLLGLFCILIFIRQTYHHFNPVYNIFSDSAQYVQRAKEIGQGKSLVHPFRYPLFPLIIQKAINPTSNAAITMKNVNMFNFGKVVGIQTYLGIFSLLLFFLVLKEISPDHIFRSVLLVLFGLNINIFGMERNVLTEPYSTAGILLYIFCIINYLKSESLFYLTAGTISSILLFLLHPTHVLLPLFVSTFGILYLIKQKKFITLAWIIAAIIIYCTIPIYYLYQNAKLYSFSGLSGITNQNLLAKAISYKLKPNYVPSDIFSKRFQECVNESIPGSEIDITKCFYPALNGYDFFDIDMSQAAGKFALKGIHDHLFEYISKSIIIIPFYLTSLKPDPVEWISIYSTDKRLPAIWNTLHSFYNLTEVCMLPFVVLFPLHLYLFFRQPDRTNTNLGIIGMVVIYNIISGTFFSFINYIRLRNPIEPLLLIFCSYYYFMIYRLRFIQKYKNIER